MTDTDAEVEPVRVIVPRSVRPRKRRTVKACDECHRRKTKCDSDSTPNGVCTNCQSLGAECTHNAEVKKRGPKAGLKRRLPSQVKTLIDTIVATPQHFLMPHNTQVLRNMLVDLAYFARALEHQIAEIRQEKNSSSHSALASQASNISDRESLADTNSPSEPSSRRATCLLHGLDIDRVHTLELVTDRLHGITLLDSEDKEDKVFENINPPQTADDMTRDDNSEGSTIHLQKRPEFWTRSLEFWNNEREPCHFPYTFPPDELLHNLVYLYFSRIHYRFQPLLHRPTFERQVFAERLHLRDGMFAATLLAVCALGSRYSNDPRNLSEGSESEHSLGWKYFRQLRLVRATTTSPQSLFEVQLCALSMSFLILVTESESDLVLAWKPCVLAMRTARATASRLQSSHDKGSIIERALWKRAYWVLVNEEFTISLLTGLPRFGNDFDVELPEECDDEYWVTQDPNSGHQLNSGVLFAQPDRPSYLAFWIYWLKLMFITVHIARTLSSMKDGSRPPATLHSLNTMLDHWLDFMPGHLRWHPHIEDPIFFDQALNLQSAYYRVQIQINKPPLSLYFGTNSITRNHFAMAKCVDAAEAYFQLVEVYHQRPNPVTVPHTVLFLCGFVLFTTLWKRTWTSSPEQESAELNKWASLLGMYERRYKLAGRLRDVMHAMISAIKLSSPSPRHSVSLQRSRNPDTPGTFATNSSMFSPAEELPHEILSLSDGPSPGIPLDSSISRPGEDWHSFMRMVDEMLGTINANPSAASYY